MSITLDGTAGISSTGGIDAADLTGALPAIDGSELTGIVSVPSGTVIYHAASTAPTGFIKANGAALSRTTYADLFAAIGTVFGAGDGSTTFLVPDLRGEFMRGWDDSRGIDASRVFGSAQADEFKSHTHTMQTNTNGFIGARIATFTNQVGSPVITGATGGAETRPRNIALLACIKY